MLKAGIGFWNIYDPDGFTPWVQTHSHRPLPCQHWDIGAGRGDLGLWKQRRSAQLTGSGRPQSPR